MKRFTLKNNVIIKGMNINKPPRSFADIASKPAPQSFQESSDTEPVTEAVDVRPSNAVLFKSTRSQVMDFINSKMGVQLEEEDICAAHELKPGRNDKVPPLVVRFTYTSVKQDVMSAKRNIPRTENIYINDQLTATNGKIFYQARSLVRNHKLHAAWTRLGQVFTKVTEVSRPVLVKSLKDLPIL